MFISFILFIGGVVALVYGANIFVTGAIAVAQRMNISPLIIGLSVVAIGTSIPEFSINVTSSLSHHEYISLGNVVGSNIANTLFIFAIAAMFVRQFSIRKQAYNQGIVFLLVSIGLFILAHFPFGNRFAMGIPSYESILLLLSGFGYFFYLYRLARRDREIVAIKHIGLPMERRSDGRVMTDILLGLFFVIIGGKFTMDAAIALADGFGISEAFIALSFIAIGTSLPELATSIVAVKKKQYDLLIGNLIGSNIINILFVLGTSMAITSIPITAETFRYIFANMIAAVIFLLSISFPRQQYFERWKTAPFIAAYLFMLYFL